MVTQKERVLRALQAAGPRGVRSDQFIKDYMPRAAARVQELRDEGVPITSEREGKYCRWTLAGSDASGSTTPRTDGLASVGESVRENLSVTSSERAVPSMFDCDVSWEDAA